MSNVFISTAIPYVNGSPHAGHTLEFVQADTLARYLRQRGHAVYFLSGTDENALKNVLAAEKAGKTTQAFVDENSKHFYDLKKLLNLSFDGFIRTTEKRHFDGTQKLWLALNPKDIYQDEYEGLYCVGCEEFKTQKELDENGLCPEHKTKPEVIREKNYFFKLSNYSKQIEELIVSSRLQIVPEKRKNEVLGFLRSGLHDFSISRSKNRSRGWGIPVPNDPDQTIYVWLDALGNYLTGLGYATDDSLYKKYWSNDNKKIHVIGKGIVKFHALYWIGLLLSAGLPLPTEEFVHGYVTVDGNKIGKSLGNAIDPKLIVDKYGIDAFRYYLLKEIPAYGDGDFSWQRMGEVYTAYLQNGLGNLLSRVSALAEKSNYQAKPWIHHAVAPSVDDAMKNYCFDEALSHIWGFVNSCNLRINEKELWKLTGANLEKELDLLVEQIRYIADSLRAFMPETSDTIVEQFAEGAIKKTFPLFPRLP